MITDHKWRERKGLVAGISPDGCCYLGICNRPKEEHEAVFVTKVKQTRERKKECESERH